MKRALSLFLAAVMVLGMLSVIPMTGFAIDPTPAVAIKTEEEFLAMDPAGTYYLDADITITKTYGAPEGETPIKPFAGFLDGNGKTVTVSAPMFHTLSGDVKNLKVKGEIVDIAFRSPQSTEAVPTIYPFDDFATGAVAAYVIAPEGKTITLEGITSDAKVSYAAKAAYKDAAGADKEAGVAAGAIYGVGNGNISVISCINNGEITGSDQVGGLVGWADRAKTTTFTMTGCVNNGAVTMTGNYGGGLVGRVSEGATVIDNCVNNGKLSCFQSQVGGIFGYAAHCLDITVKNCVNNGEISDFDPADDKVPNMGGIIGATSAGANDVSLTIDNCVNTADLKHTVATGAYIAGIAARLQGASKDGVKINILNCLNKGAIDNGNGVAGILGLSQGKSGHLVATTITNCVNLADINANSSATSGTVRCAGIVAHSEYTQFNISHCFNSGNLTGSETNAISTRMGGVIGYLGGDTKAADKSVSAITGCVNLGDVKAANSTSIVGGIGGGLYQIISITNCYVDADIIGRQAGGVYGYQYGSDGKGAWPVIKNCVVYGTVTGNGDGTQGTSAVVAYYNAAGAEISNNYIDVVVTAVEGATKPASVLCWNNKSANSADKVFNNFIPTTCTTPVGIVHNPTATDNEQVQVSLADAIAAGFLKNETAENAMAAINTAAGATLYEIKDGKILPICDHNFPKDGAKCSVCGYIQSTAITTEAEFLAMAPDGSYYLNADITLTQSYDKTFTGNFDGNGKTVTITSGAMFITVENANISNFTVKGDLAPTAAGYAVGSNDFYAAVAVVANGASAFKKITSDVNFTATLSTTRYGAIAATSAKNHALLIEECVNNGNITTESYAGGVYGWTDKIGNSTIKKCINNGNVTIANGYGAGIVCRLAGSGEGGTVNVDRCVNNGDITVNGDQGGGIMAYANTPNVSITNCVNNGDILNNKKHAGGILGGIGDPKAKLNWVFTGNVNNGKVTVTTSSYAGGIVANIANPKIGGTYTVNYNINTGDIVGGGNNSAGIVAYAYGRTTEGDEAFLTAIGNVNTGTITNSKWASQIVCYTNANMTVISNNIAVGKLVLDGTTEPAADAGQRVIVGLSSADITKYTIKDNYWIENDGTVYYSYATAAANVANQVAFADRPAGSINIITAAQIADTMATVNTAIGSAVYEMKGGKIALICDHDYPQVDGKCAACGYVEGSVPPPAHEHTLVDVAEVPATCTEKGTAAGKKCTGCDYVEGMAEIPALGHSFAEGKCSVCQAEDPDYNVENTTSENPGSDDEPTVTTTEAPGTTEPADDSCAGCGGFGAFAALLAIVCGAAVVIIKKKA